MNKREHLIAVRKTIGTQESVAKELGISRQFLSMIEIGERNPTIKLMAKMEKYFNSPAKKLFPDLFFEHNCHKTLQSELPA
ncbi:helix-turn-helix transcriptional regulator [Robertmurraya sp.]|uniref:helix-turn-helix transcriptional regulator n=1 Tax=Robertmurraya sp. TaxID=2837525 RepID=UPI003703EC37